MKSGDSERRKIVNTIFTHDEAMQILELFEHILEEHDVTIPSPEDNDREEDNTARLYGSVYSDLLDEVEDRLISLLDKHNKTTSVITGEFSGTV